jgi:hypothetical protein
MTFAGPTDTRICSSCTGRNHERTGTGRQKDIGEKACIETLRVRHEGVVQRTGSGDTQEIYDTEIAEGHVGQVRRRI